jgi:serine/threonine protein kinase
MGLHALQPGYMLAEYQIDRLLGEGGFGLTYLAFDTHLEKKVAIKEYMPGDFCVRQNATTIVPKSEAAKTDYEWGLNAFITEAKTLARFDDPNIVRIFRFFKENGTAYLVMEYCEGGCLSERFSADKPLSEQAVRGLLSPLMNGLQLVHDGGVYHRDIKPDNIMFRLDGTPVLIDFGAARQVLGAKSRSITTIVTPGYAPLEQYSSKGKLGPWTDIYSLAAVAFACLTGNRPPDATERIIDDEIEPLASSTRASAFLKTIDKALSVKAAGRPQNLSDWYALWEDDDEAEIKPNPKPAKDDLSQLDDVIEMAGADGVITNNEMTMLFNKAKQLGLDFVEAQSYIVQQAQHHGWELQIQASSTATKGEDVIRIVEVSEQHASVGGNVEFTLAGKQLKLNMPANTKNGAKFRLTNVAKVDADSSCDTFIVINIVSQNPDGNDDFVDVYNQRGLFKPLIDLPEGIVNNCETCLGVGFGYIFKGRFDVPLPVDCPKCVNAQQTKSADKHKQENTEFDWSRQLQRMPAGPTNKTVLYVPANMSLKEQLDIKAKVKSAHGVDIRILIAPVAACLALVALAKIELNDYQDECYFVVGVNESYDNSLTSSNLLLDYALVEISFDVAQLQNDDTIEVFSSGCIKMDQMTSDKYQALIDEVGLAGDEIKIITYTDKITQLNKLGSNKKTQLVNWPTEIGSAPVFGSAVQHQICDGTIRSLLLLNCFPHAMDVYFQRGKQLISPSRRSVIDKDTLYPTKSVDKFSIESKDLKKGLEIVLAESILSDGEELRMEIIKTIPLKFEPKYLTSKEYVFEIAIDVDADTNLMFSAKNEELGIFKV